MKTGGTGEVTVHVSAEAGGASSATVTLRAVSESDPSKVAEAAVRISKAG